MPSAVVRTTVTMVSRRQPSRHPRQWLIRSIPHLPCSVYRSNRIRVDNILPYYTKFSQNIQLIYRVVFEWLLMTIIVIVLRPISKQHQNEYLCDLEKNTNILNT